MVRRLVERAGAALHPLDRKLLRDLWRLRGQVLAIGMVIASGLAVLVMSLGSMVALRDSANAYYERQGFAHVFAELKRAPSNLVPRIAALPGVQSVQTRISKVALLDLEGFEERWSPGSCRCPSAVDRASTARCFAAGGASSRSIGTRWS